MRLKTIREQLLFAADFHHQTAKTFLKSYHELYSINKPMARKAKESHAAHYKMSLALDEALKLL